MTRFLVFAAAIITFSFSSCTKDSCTNKVTYTEYTPVYVLPEEYKKPARTEAPKTITHPGKIYFYKDYIFINEIREGFHMVNNQDPSNPVNERFIAISGNIDFAVMNDYLYADSYTDLVIIDLRNIQNPTQVFRKEGVFNTHYFTNGSNALLSHYKETDITTTIDCDDPHWGNTWFFNKNGNVLIDVFAFDNAGSVNSSNNGSPVVGQGGSMARFTITHSHLYAIGNSEMYAMPIQSNGDVSEPVKTQLPWGIETLFPYQNYLFVGANNGMHIMDLKIPSAPVHVSTFTHARACDPVVVQNDIAFVTLRSGSRCDGFLNQLEVLDVKDILNPKLLHTFPMENPHGLAVEGNYLYLCEGEFGLKVFDISDLSKIGQKKVEHKTGFHAWDAIAVKNKALLVIGNDGFRQYDYKKPTDLKLLSRIDVKR
ncbi:MAG: hypothetical protein IPM42_05395 [Saprospiraceae bacterium]|nr:hypothetical protein [Saprospiraceae bacterium]